MDPAFSSDADILRAFYPTEEVKVTPGSGANLVKKIACGDVAEVDGVDLGAESSDVSSILVVLTLVLLTGAAARATADLVVSGDVGGPVALKNERLLLPSSRVNARRASPS